MRLPEPRPARVAGRGPTWRRPACSPLAKSVRLVPVASAAEAGLVREVLAVVDQPRLDVPRHAERGAVDDAALPGPRKNCDWSITSFGRRIERAGLGELPHPGRARACSRPVSGRRRSRSRSCRARRRTGTGVTLTVASGFSFSKSAASVAELVALGAHRPDRDGALGRALR